MGDAPKAALAGVVAGGLIGGLLCGVGHGVVIIDLMLAGAIVLLMFLRRRRAVTAASPCALADVSSAVETASRGSGGRVPPRWLQPRSGSSGHPRDGSRIRSE
jgi:predicted lipid-binding transport protein (Tim44 family)